MTAARLIALALATMAAALAAASWPKTFSGAGGFDTGTEVAVDSEANVYVAGSRANAAGDDDIFLVKYTQSGKTEWVQTWDSGGDDTSADIAVDVNGNAYIVGKSDGNGTFDVIIVKFDTDGNRKWARAIDGPAGGDDYGAAVKVDNAGNVVITGTQLGPSENFVTIKYTSNGGRLWTRTYSGPGGGADNAVDLVIGTDDSVYVTGRAWTGSSGFDFATIKYTPTGTRAWLRMADGQGFDDDTPAGIAIDQNEDVVVTGSSLGFISSDILTVRYSQNGNREWRLRLGAAGVNEYANAVTMDAVGNVYIAATAGDGNDSAVQVIKLFEGGLKEWSKTYSASSTASMNVGVGIEVSDAGVVYVGATTSSDATEDSRRMTILKYSNTGTRLAVERFGLAPTAQSVAVGFTLDKTTFRAFVTGHGLNPSNGTYDGLTARR